MTKEKFEDRNQGKPSKNGIFRGRSRAVATYKVERFLIILNSFQLLTIITKRSILDVVAAPDPPLILRNIFTDFLKIETLNSVNSLIV